MFIIQDFIYESCKKLTKELNKKSFLQKIKLKN